MRTTRRKKARSLTRAQREARQDKRDIAAANRGLRDLRKHGGYYTHDARQIANW